MTESDRGVNRIELISVLLIALTAVATAWSAFQASRWGAEMTLAQESVSTLRFTNLNEPADISAPPLEEPETEG